MLAVRDAREHDLDAAAALMVDAYREYEPLLTPAAWQVYAADIGAVRERPQGSQLIVGEDQGRLCAAVTYYRPGLLGAMPEDWAYLRLLATARSERGNGWGAALVNDVIARARADGARELGIHNAAFMTAARRLYERAGFVAEPRFDMAWPDAMRDASSLTVNAYRLALAGRAYPEPA